MELTLIPSQGSNIQKYSEPILADSKLTKTETNLPSKYKAKNNVPI